MSRRRPAPAKTSVAVPVPARTIWRWLIRGGGALVVAGTVVWAAVLGWPQRIAHEASVASAAAGLQVRQVEIEGVERQPKLAVYEALLSGGTDAMAGLDLRGARDRLEALPWVEEATLERRWPDRLRVIIVEKQPVALWQHRGRIQLVDRSGQLLPVADLRAFHHLPLVVGPGANSRAAELAALSARAPALFDALTAAVWVGDRRWDLKMRSGETVSLPEGPAAGTALEKLAAIDRATPILGRGFVRFDLRIPEKLVVRVSGETGATAKPRATPPAPAAPAAPARPAATMAALPPNQGVSI